MSEAPKRVWIHEGFWRSGDAGYGTRDDVREIPYIRADIADELVEALNELMYARTDKAESMAEAALKKLEEE